MPLDKISITKDFSYYFPELVSRFDPQKRGEIALADLDKLPLDALAYLFTDAYRDPDNAGLDLQYWKTYTPVSGKRWDSVCSLLWSADIETAKKMRCPQNSLETSLHFPILVEGVYQNNQMIQKALEAALKMVVLIGPPEGRPNPFEKNRWIFVPRFESIAIVFESENDIFKKLPKEAANEVTENKTFDALTVRFSTDEAPMVVVHLFAERLLGDDAKIPGRLLIRLVTVLAHEIYGNVVTTLTHPGLPRVEREKIAFQTGIDFIHKVLKKSDRLPPHFVEGFERQLELEKRGLEGWSNIKPE